jgi:hypothetical protein
MFLFEMRSAHILDRIECTLNGCGRSFDFGGFGTIEGVKTGGTSPRPRETYINQQPRAGQSQDGAQQVPAGDKMLKISAKKGWEQEADAGKYSTEKIMMVRCSTRGNPMYKVESTQALAG